MWKSPVLPRLLSPCCAASVCVCVLRHWVLSGHLAWCVARVCGFGSACLWLQRVTPVTCGFALSVSANSDGNSDDRASKQAGRQAGGAAC